jgi:hypothetical protein
MTDAEPTLAIAANDQTCCNGNLTTPSVAWRLQVETFRSVRSAQASLGASNLATRIEVPRYPQGAERGIGLPLSTERSDQ